MLSANHGDVVGEGERVVVIVTGRAGSAVRAELTGDDGLEAGGHSAVLVDAEGAGIDAGGRGADVHAARDGDVGGVDGGGVDGPILTDGPGLDALVVAGRGRGEKDVGGREEAGGLVAIQQVTAVEVILRVDGVVFAGDELLVEGLRRNGVADDAAVVGVVVGLNGGKVLLQSECLRVPGGGGGVLVARDERTG